MRSGWLEVHERQFVRVRRKLAANTMRRADLQRTIRSIAHKWKLWGGEEQTLIRMIVELVQEVFASRPNLVFAECNAHDLDVMGRRLAEGLKGAPITRSLIADLDRGELQRASAVVLVPYYHYAEVKAIVGQKVPIVPVHTSPSVDTLDKLLTIPAGARVLIVGHNKRSIERLSGMVRDYAQGVAITGVTMNDAAKVKKLFPSSDAVVAVKAAVEALPILSNHKRLIAVEFAIEASVADRLRPPRANGAAAQPFSHRVGCRRSNADNSPAMALFRGSDRLIISLANDRCGPDNCLSRIWDRKQAARRCCAPSPGSIFPMFDEANP